MKEVYSVDFMTTRCGYLYDCSDYYNINEIGSSTYMFDSILLNKLMVEKTLSPFYVREILTGIYIPLVSINCNGLVRGFYPLLISTFIMGKMVNGKISIADKCVSSEELEKYYFEHQDIFAFKSHLAQVIKVRDDYAHHEYYINVKNGKNLPKVFTLLKKRS